MNRFSKEKLVCSYGTKMKSGNENGNETARIILKVKTKILTPVKTDFPSKKSRMEFLG